jgi:hypothetical protein
MSAPQPKEKVPFVGTVLGPYMGYKQLLHITQPDRKLASTFRLLHEWWPERTMETAQCIMAPVIHYFGAHLPPHPSGAGDQRVPHEEHSCGYYMCYRFQEATNGTSAHNRIAATQGTGYDCIALVAAWGDVIHHEKGLRSSHMEIAAFYRGGDNLSTEIEDLAELMGVPCLDLAGLDALAKDMGVLCA